MPWLEEKIESQLFPELEKRIGTLRAYYQEEAARSIQGTQKVQGLTRGLTVMIVLLSLIQGTVLLFGIQRWLVRPLADIGRSTAVISTGNFLSIGWSVGHTMRWGTWRKPSTGWPRICVRARLVWFNPSASPRLANWEQVLVAVLANAIEASAPENEVFITSQVMREAVAIQIRDEGLGIPEDIRDKVFDPYFTTKADGVGLGLAMAKKVMQTLVAQMKRQPGRIGWEGGVRAGHRDS